MRRQRLGGQAQYFLPQGPHWLFYAAASGDMLTNPDPADTLLLGGLRIFSVRAAFSNVVHLDLAFPLDPDSNVKRAQFLVKTKARF